MKKIILLMVSMATISGCMIAGPKANTVTTIQDVVTINTRLASEYCATRNGELSIWFHEEIVESETHIDCKKKAP